MPCLNDLLAERPFPTSAFYTIYFLHRKLFSDPDLAFRGCSEGPTPSVHFCAGLYHPKTNSGEAVLKSKATSTPQEPSSSRRHFRNSYVSRRSSKGLLGPSGFSLLGDLTEDHLTNSKT